MQMAKEEEAQQDALARKADTATVFRALDLKPDRSEMTAALAKKADAAQLTAMQGACTGQDVAVRLAALQDQVSSKASSKVRAMGSALLGTQVHCNDCTAAYLMRGLC